MGRYTVIGRRCLVIDGQTATLPLQPVIEEHNHYARDLLRDAA